MVWVIFYDAYSGYTYEKVFQFVNCDRHNNKLWRFLSPSILRFQIWINLSFILCSIRQTDSDRLTVVHYLWTKSDLSNRPTSPNWPMDDLSVCGRFNLGSIDSSRAARNTCTCTSRESRFHPRVGRRFSQAYLQYQAFHFLVYFSVPTHFHFFTWDLWTVCEAGFFH